MTNTATENATNTGSNTGNAHDGSQPPVAGDTSTFLSHAEWVRTLLGDGGFATLTTNTPAGFPYGSMVAYSVLADGSPLVCISELAEHTRNAQDDPRAGLFVSAAVAGAGADPMDEPRASLIGHLLPYQPDAEAVDRHVAAHPTSAGYLSFPDFGWWRLAVQSTRFVGGFGSMSWVDGSLLAAAAPDPVVLHATYAIDHMNADHAEANLDIARHLAGLTDAESAVVHSIDRHGVTLYVQTPSGERTARIGFTDRPLTSPDQIRSAVVELTHRARAGAVAPPHAEVES